MGHFFDLSIDKRTSKMKSDASFSSKSEIRTKVDRAKRTAVIEVAIRSPDVLASLKADASLPLGMFRMEGKSPRQFLAWSPTLTARPNFHVPEAFGSLVLAR
jgi:hypothetical protein